MEDVHDGCSCLECDTKQHNMPKHKRQYDTLQQCHCQQQSLCPIRQCGVHGRLVVSWLGVVDWVVGLGVRDGVNERNE